MVSYYGNMGTWLCRGALRPYLPCLLSTLHIHAPETWICLALLHMPSCEQTGCLGMSQPFHLPSLPLCLCHRAKDGGMSPEDVGGGGQGTVP